MSFTSITVVRKHLLGALVAARDVNALPITLVGENELALPDINLVESSDVVKWKYTVHPCVDGPLALVGDKTIAIKDHHLVPGTAVVTIDDGLSTIYFEEKDFRIDYINGTIARLVSGTIPDNQPVYVYYEKYELFTRGSDYDIDYESGLIERLHNSAIPDSATVLIDYTVSKGGITDDAIDQAIVEASDIVVRSLAPEYTSSSTDQGLKTGTTLLTLSIVAQAFAADVLSSNRASDAYTRSREWQNLSKLWETKAWETLGPFLDHSQLRSPVAQ
jgi:hypothetical protein